MSLMPGIIRFIGTMEVVVILLLIVLAVLIIRVARGRRLP